MMIIGEAIMLNDETRPKCADTTALRSNDVNVVTFDDTPATNPKMYQLRIHNAAFQRE